MHIHSQVPYLVRGVSCSRGTIGGHRMQAYVGRRIYAAGCFVQSWLSEDDDSDIILASY
jgi:hypothetical protein